MKSYLFILALFVAAGLKAQTGSISNIEVIPYTDGTGMVEITYDLEGAEPEYEISLEVSFDGEGTFTAIDIGCITGDIGEVQPGIDLVLILWDGECSSPGVFSTQTQIKLSASFNPGWTCGDQTVRDGQSYNTVQIGTQCWMARI
ncbi:MAG: hypothetical protein R2764_12865 [Bacteroidales bacterium]